MFIQWLLTYSSSSSYPFFTLLYLSINNVCKKAVPTQDVTNPVSLPSFYCLYIFLSSLTLRNISFLTCLVQLISIPLQHHISKLSSYFCSTVPSVRVLAPYKYFTLTKCNCLYKCRETHFTLHNITLQVGQFCIVALHMFCALFVSTFLTKLKNGCKVQKTVGYRRIVPYSSV